MIELKKIAKQVLNQLVGVLKELDQEDYAKKIDLFNGHSLGGHVRHTLEFFGCLLAAKTTGHLNYDLRERNLAVETNRTCAVDYAAHLIKKLDSVWEDEPLTLSANYGTEAGLAIDVPTSISRELAYNIEHAVHHMAILKIGLREVAPALNIPDSFGVASSTLRYHRAQAVQ